MMKQWKRMPLVALLGNLILLYILYAITRLVFVGCNMSHFADHLSWGYMWSLLVAGLRFDTTAILYLNFPLILAFLFPCHLKGKRFYRILRWYFVIVNFVGLSANLCDCAYYPFTVQRTTANVFSEFGNESHFLTILLHEALPYWYLFVIAFAIAFVLWRGFCTPTYYETEKAKPHAKRRGRVVYYAVQILAFALAIPLTIAGMRGGFTKAVRPITLSNANQYVHHSVDAAIVLNTPFSIIRTVNKKSFPKLEYMSQEEAEALYSPVHMPSTLAPDTAAFQPMNVVVLIMESFGKQASARGFMPFVDSLSVRGRSYQYSFANGRKSIDGMPSVLSSIPSLLEPFFSTPAALNELSGLAGELSRKKGYTSAFFHGAENGSMGFQAFANATGFQQYYGRTEYNADPRYDGDKDFDGTWAIWDEPFLQFFCDKMSELPQPFITSVFTASSHSPFRMPEQYQGQFPEGPTPLYACISYSDHALQLFFEKASRQPWFDNTLFVITADHATAADDAFYKTDIGLYSVPIIFYAPSMPELSGTDSTRIASQIDIMPTVLGLLHYDLPYVAFGQDLMSTSPEECFALNYLSVSGCYQYLQQDWLLQFDGEKVAHAYQFKQDSLIQHDLSGQHPRQLEERMKSVIQQYMQRMNQNELTIKP